MNFYKKKERINYQIKEQTRNPCQSRFELFTHPFVAINTVMIRISHLCLSKPCSYPDSLPLVGWPPIKPLQCLLLLFHIHHNNTHRLLEIERERAEINQQQPSNHQWHVSSRRRRSWWQWTRGRRACTRCHGVSRTWSPLTTPTTRWSSSTPNHLVSSILP